MLDAIHPINFQGFQQSPHISLPYGNYLKFPDHANMLLITDATGLLYLFLDEGINHTNRRAQDAAHPASEAYRKPDSGLSIYAQFLCLVIYPDLRCALAGRQFVYSLPPAFYYPLLTMFLRLKLKTCKMTMQG